MVLFCHYALVLPVRGVLGADSEALAVQGWVGVTLFFVLSGFLITGILYDAKGQSHYFRNFYARRTLRIFPLYYGVLAVELLVLLVIKFGFPHAWLHLHNPQKLWAAMPWFWSYTTNVGMAFFHIHTVLQGHFWSLAVEEQFYLVWPVLILLLSRRGLIRACLALVVIAFATRFLLTALGRGPFAAYSFTPCQFDALGLGALVAILAREPAGHGWLKRYSPPVLAAAATLTLVSFFTIVALRINPASLGEINVRVARGGNAGGFVVFRDVPWLCDVLYAPLDAAFAALLAAIVTGASARLGAFFSWTPLRALGGYSYGLYVFHFIVFVILGNLLLHFPRIRDATTNQMLPAIGLLLTNLVISLTLAVASFHLYEKRFLKLKKNFPERAAAAVPPQ
ncbi:MAG: acyltransferase [Phycisphaerae bacterium]|nr:acyltransferase [Phycisphaerae bacterium]